MTTVKASVHGSIIQSATFKPDSPGSITWVDYWHEGRRTTQLDFVARAREPWKRPADHKTPYEPSGTQVGATVSFTRGNPDDMVTLSGQVWSLAHRPHSVWVVTDWQGQYLIDTRTMHEIPV